MQLLSPRAALPSCISHQLRLALLCWEAVPGRAVEQAAHGKDFPRFSHWLCPEQLRDRQAQVLGTAMPKQPCAPWRRHRHLTPPLALAVHGHSSFPNLGFHFPKAAAESWPQLCSWTDQGQHIHQSSPGLLCATSSARALGKLKPCNGKTQIFPDSSE